MGRCSASGGQRQYPGQVALQPQVGFVTFPRRDDDPTTEGPDIVTRFKPGLFILKRFKETGNPTAVFQRHIRMEQRRRFFGVFKIADQFGFARLKNRHLFFHRRRVETIHYGLHHLLYLALDLRHFGTFRDDVA